MPLVERKFQISKAHPKKVVVIYNSPDVDDFDECEEKYDYVYIRDMMYEDLLPKKGLAEWHSKLIRYGDVKQMSEFQRHNGYFLGNKKNMVHFLLKYRYLQNWEREVRENYFSYSLNDVMEGLEDYDCIHYERYALPFLRGVIKKDFDIDFNEMTHVKMVFRHR